MAGSVLSNYTIPSTQTIGPSVASALNSSSTLLVGVLAAIVSYLWIYRSQQRSNLGPKAWPILGSYLEVRRNSHRFHDWVAEYMMKSPTATMTAEVMGAQFVWIGHPDNVQFVLKSNFANFPKGDVMRSRFTELLGDGIFAADGDVWKQHRKIASLEFTGRKLRDFTADVYREHTLRLVHVLDNASIAKREVDFQDLVLRMTLDSICKVGFGVDFRSLSPDLPDIEFGKCFDRAAEMTQKRQFSLGWQLLKKFDLGSERQLREDVAELDKFTYDIISKRKAELLALKAEGKELEKHDLLSRFMAAKDEDGQSLTDKVLRDAVMNFMLAGRDTTAFTLSWFIYCLCCHPDVAEKCFQETREVIGEVQAGESFSQFADLLTYESLAKMPYLHAALTETLRLHPVVAKDSKSVLKDCVLPDGTFLKKGSTVTYHPYGMGRLESLWGPDATKFRPERWLKDGVFEPQSPFKFASFQAGPRICLGKDTAYMQMKMTGAQLVRFFKFQLVPNHPIHYRVSLVMSLLYGLKITASRRSGSQ